MTRGNLATMARDVEARARGARALRPQSGRPRKMVRAEPLSQEPRPKAPVLAPPWRDEARKLRSAGWSLPGLARRYCVDQFEVARALGENLEKVW